MTSFCLTLCSDDDGDQTPRPMDLTLNDALLVSDQHSQMVGAVQAALVL